MLGNLNDRMWLVLIGSIYPLRSTTLAMNASSVSRGMRICPLASHRSYDLLQLTQLHEARGRDGIAILLHLNHEHTTLREHIHRLVSRTGSFHQVDHPRLIARCHGPFVTLLVGPCDVSSICSPIGMMREFSVSRMGFRVM